MITAKETDNEKGRLQDLESYEIMDTEDEQDFDDLTRIASELCGTKVAFVSLLDDKRQWFKSMHGLDIKEAPKEIAFCSHAINEPEKILLVEDARKDQRFFDNPLVTNDPYVIFYAGVPLVSPNGYPLGTFCVVDNAPKKLSKTQIEHLSILSRQVMKLLELRKRNKELKKNNELLNVQQQDLKQFSLLAEELKEGIVITDSEGKVEWLNKGFTGISGFTLEDMLGKKPGGVLQGADTDQTTVENIRRGLNSGKSFHVEILNYHKNGTPYWSELHITPLLGKDNKPEKYISTQRDITMRRKVMEELTFTKDLLETTSRVSKVGGWDVDLTEGTLHWSDVTKEIHEVPYDYEPNLDKTLNFYKEGENRDRITHKIYNSMDSGEGWDMELQLVTAKGRDIWVRSRGKIEKKNGICTRLYGTFEEITEKKESQRLLEEALTIAREAAIAKSSFLSNMSHEIRTPLNAVIGMAHLLLQNDPREDQLERLNTLHFSANNLLSLVNDILDFSKIEEGKVTFESITFDIIDLVNNLKHAFSYRADEKNIGFKVNMDMEVPRLVKGDPTRLIQILNNLVSNAIKFTNEGKVKLSIEVEYEIEDKIGLYFEVKDTGIGMTEAQLQKVFDRFAQASSGTTRKFGGTGLGLSIVRGLLELQGSKVDIESKEGKGTTFSFVLELEQSNDKNFIQTNNIPSTGTREKDLNGMRILLVEDNQVNQLVATEFLKSWNVVLDYALNGVEAVEKVAENDYDVILMDIQMPEMDGYQATMRIKAMENEKAKIPILAMTASAMIEAKDKIFEIGMEEHILKPFNPQELNDKLSRYLVDKKKEGRSGKEEERSTKLSPLNLDAMEMLFNGDDSFKKKLMDNFLHDLEKFGKEYTLAVSNQDKTKIGFITHRNKSVISMLSLKELEKILNKNYDNLEKGEWQKVNLDKVLNELEITKAKIKKVLRDIVFEN